MCKKEHSTILQPGLKHFDSITLFTEYLATYATFVFMTIFAGDNDTWFPSPHRIFMSVASYIWVYAETAILSTDIRLAANTWPSFWDGPCPQVGQGICEGVFRRVVHRTVPSFNSCTKCACSPGVIHDRTPDNATQFLWHGCMDVTSKYKSILIVFDSQATTLIDVLVLFFDLLSIGCLYNHALADVQSTSAGIEFLPLWGVFYS